MEAPITRTTIAASIYLFKVNNRDTRKRREICSKLTIKTSKRHHWRHYCQLWTYFTSFSSVSIVDFHCRQVNVGWIFRKIYKSGVIFDPLNFCWYVIQILRKKVLILFRVVSSIITASRNQVNWNAMYSWYSIVSNSYVIITNTERQHKVVKLSLTIDAKRRHKEVTVQTKCEASQELEKWRSNKNVANQFDTRGSILSFSKKTQYLRRFFYN